MGELVLRNATRLTRLVTMRNPVARFLRNQVAGVLGLLPSFRRAFVRNLTETAIHYPHSPLNSETGGFAASGIRPGDRVPDARLREAGTGNERRLLVLLRGPSHHLLLLPQEVDSAALAGLGEIGRRVEEVYPGLVKAHLVVPAEVPAGGAGLASVWVDAANAVQGLFGAWKTALAVVRPDGYLGYRGQPALWEDLRAYLDRYLITRPA